jgi:CheY-like chemotaxis protein
VTAVERYVKEIDRLDRAILMAQAEQDLAAEAIAHECTAEVYLEWGKPKVAAVYLQDAHDCYTRTGDRTYVENLERNYPQLQRSSLPTRQQFGGTKYFTDEFVATVSHEFRNPLNGILGMSEALLEGVFGTLNESQLNAVNTIDRSGEYLLALIDNMADLSQIQAGKLELELDSVTVAELCQSSAAFVKHHAIQKQIKLDLNIPPDACSIAVDLQRMRQVLINLLSHAIDSTPVGGKVELVVRKVGEIAGTDRVAAMQFLIIDTSKELPTVNMGEAAQCFPPNEDRRLGLGLMLVQPIVELHGGTLSCQSKVGQGNCFKISLPHNSSSLDITMDDTSYEPDDSDDKSIIISGNSVPPSILIVEDNELNINTISSYLTVKGYHPIVANDGQSAIELAQKYHPDLILMDIQMPGMDGLAAISHIRQHPQLVEIPIIALTALAMEGDRQKCLNAGANDYLTKPVKLKQLHETIQQFLVAKIDNIGSRDLWS